MCYFLYIASPLTLSEVRSMLPPGLVADLAAAPCRTTLQQLHPSAKTVARLLVGACSCDLVRTRLDDPLKDERELRARYRKAGLSRAEMIRELDRHRRGASRTEPPVDWAKALADFVIEHARNAGPTLYYLDFAPAGVTPSPGRTAAPTPRPVTAIRVPPQQWLPEGQPALVA